MLAMGGGEVGLRGVAAGVSQAGSHPGVRDDGFQAGVNEVKESGIGVAPPRANKDEVDGCGAWIGGRPHLGGCCDL